MAGLKDCEFGKFLKPASRQSMKPLGVINSISSYDRKAGFYGTLPKSPPGVRKSLFESRSKENDDSIIYRDFSDKEITDKSPIVVQQRFKNEPKSDEAAEKNVKPRRSMLGRRSKVGLPNIQSFSKDDSSYSISKPLHSSSPVGQDSYSVDNYNLGRHARLMKTTSTPSLNHPFDADDADASSFFSKGLSESTWSVFKSNNRNTEKSTHPQETPLSRTSVVNGAPRYPTNNNDIKNSTNWRGIKSTLFTKENAESSSLTVEQKSKLESLQLKFQKDVLFTAPGSNMGYEMHSDTAEDKRYQSEKVSSTKNKMEMDEKQASFGTRTRAQAKKEKEKFMFKSISPIIHENRDFLGNHVHDQDQSLSSQDHSQNSSTDSYVQNEATIVRTLGKQFSDIHEEQISNLTITNETQKSCEESNCSDEYLSTNEDDSDINRISNLMAELKEEKESLDAKLAAYVQHKESYDKKWNNLMSNLDDFLKDINRKSAIPVSEKLRKKKVIYNKSRQSHGHRSSPAVSLSKSTTVGGTKNFTGLKSNFNCIKTPLQTHEKIRKLRKSNCYTPKSLSVLVGDQVNDIFGDM